MPTIIRHHTYTGAEPEVTPTDETRFHTLVVAREREQGQPCDLYLFSRDGSVEQGPGDCLGCMPYLGAIEIKAEEVE